MVDAVVQMLVEKLSSLLQEEAVLLTGVRDEAEYMKDELERVKAFLRVADAKSESDEQLKVWVNQVRDVSYDIEDVLDEFSIRLSRRDHENTLCGCLDATSFSLRNLKARHEIASKIQRLKARVADVAAGHQRYRDPNYQQPSTSTYDWRNVGLLPIEADLVVGIVEPKRKLVNWLVGGGSSDAQLKCISVVGMGGCGKTTLVQQVYCDAVVKQHFDSHLWQVVPKSFNIDELMKEMIQNLFAENKQPAPPGLSSMDPINLKWTIAQFLEQRRFLIVIDDVWKDRDWEVIRMALPENGLGSRIMLTTRSMEIASTACADTNGYIYFVGPLSEGAAWNLFCKKAFRSDCCPPLLEDVSRTILRRCEALPLAIVTIGGALATKDQSRIDVWEMFCHSLPFELHTNSRLERIKELLCLSYYELPDYYLKICFLYMYVFPDDYEIERAMLIRLWTAEGFVQERDGVTKEQVADSFLQELVNRSLVQVTEVDARKRIRKCRIHDILRKVVLSKAKEQRIVTISSNQSKSLWPNKVRRLAVHGSEGISHVSDNCFKYLRSLLVLSSSSSFSRSKLVDILSHSKLLKVLDLRGVQLDVVPDEIFDLVHLVYLSMRGTGLTQLPEKLDKLENLETLDLKNTRIIHLPDGILKLRKLRHLLVYSYDKASSLKPFHSVRECTIPSSIGCLLSLQKLCYIDASNSMIVQELGSLTQLRRLGITKLRREDGKALCTSIARLSNLQALHIRSLNEDENLDIDSLSVAPLRCLQNLHLRGPLYKAPVWINSVQSLVRILLTWSKLKEDPLNFLQSLPNLTVLLLGQAYEGEGLQFKAGGFRRLQTLYVLCSKELRWVRVEEYSMPELEILYIQDCESMEELPIGIQYLTKLQYLQIADMPIVEQFRHEKREHQDYGRIAHIPRVVYGNHVRNPKGIFRL